MPRKSYPELLDGWSLLNNNVKALGSTEPHLEERRRELETEIETAWRLRNQQKKLLGKLHTNSRQLEQAVARGKEAESRLRALLRGTYGAANPHLVQYGIPPRRRPRRKAGGTVEEELPAVEGTGGETEE
jgi:hypothetical protein